MNWCSCMCCPESLYSREEEMPPMQAISSLDTPERVMDPLSTPSVKSQCTTRNAPGADEQEDTKRLSVLLGHDLRMFQGYKQESSDSEEESTSDLDIERGNLPDHN